MTLDEVVVDVSALGASRPERADLVNRRTTTGDTADLLRGVPGLALNGAGGISSLPSIHGLADDRLRIQVDGADLMPACPNHMNSPLSYADPAKVVSVTVYSGATPVSVGGDSVGGSILVKTAPPEFAGAGEKLLVRGEAGSFYRSNGGALGYSLGATLAGSWLNLTFSQSSSQSDNLIAGGDFKAVAPGREGGPPIPADEIGSSAYRGATRRSLGLAARRGDQELQLELSQQLVTFEGFPNQRMDMTANDNRLLNLRYAGLFGWGDLEARLSYQTTQHTMDMGPDRYTYGTGMPMETTAKTRGAQLRANVDLTERDKLRTGVEYQYYTLFDWWPPVGGTMGPNTFWNIDFGERQKVDAFVEWVARWSDAWTSQAGVRGGTVLTDAGPVQGYDNGLAGLWGDDAAAFNASQRRRTDLNWDLTALARYTATPTQTYEAGYARKVRSPNLYQRYAWSTNPMAALMNNLVGDGNGYVGRVDLRPEVAHTFSLTGAWHDAARRRWSVKATGTFTHVEDFIDARRCDFGQCSATNVTTPTGFVLLQYANKGARLYGLDLSGQALLVEPGKWGSVTAGGALGYLRGDDLSDGGGLHDIMPPNATASATHRLGGWRTTVEALAVGAKRRVSLVRNEVQTGGYALLNLRGGYEWEHARLDLGVENLFDRSYANPLGGAYVGQGPSMSTTGIPWGVPVPGPGRSVNVALNLRY